MDASYRLDRLRAVGLASDQRFAEEIRKWCRSWIGTIFRVRRFAQLTAWATTAHLPVLLRLLLVYG
jgi:hypothetical protein